MANLLKKTSVNISDCNIVERFIAGLQHGFMNSKWVVIAGLFFLLYPVGAMAVPAAPTLISPSNGATNVSVTPTFSWSSNGGTTYGLYLSQNVGGTYTLVFDGDSYYPTGYSGLSMGLSGLQAGTQYRWNMRAHDATGWGSFTGLSYFTTASNVPTAPSNLQATVDGSQVSLTWTDNSTNETGFTIHGITDGSYSSMGANITADTINLNSFGSSHCFEVAALYSGGTSAYSNQVCVTPMAQASLSSPSFGYIYIRPGQPPPIFPGTPYQELSVMALT